MKLGTDHDGSHITDRSPLAAGFSIGIIRLSLASRSRLSRIEMLRWHPVLPCRPAQQLLLLRRNILYPVSRQHNCHVLSHGPDVRKDPAHHLRRQPAGPEQEPTVSDQDQRLQRSVGEVWCRPLLSVWLLMFWRRPMRQGFRSERGSGKGHLVNDRFASKCNVSKLCAGHYKAAVDLQH